MKYTHHDDTIGYYAICFACGVRYNLTRPCDCGPCPDCGVGKCAPCQPQCGACFDKDLTDNLFEVECEVCHEIFNDLNERANACQSCRQEHIYEDSHQEWLLELRMERERGEYDDFHNDEVRRQT